MLKSNLPSKRASSAFKSPFRRPLQDSNDHPATNSQLQAKKTKLDVPTTVSSAVSTTSTEPNDAENEPIPTPSAQTTRLEPKKLGISKFKTPLRLTLATSKPNVDTSAVEAQGNDLKCYSVMWRKPSNKKHKGWDGDGILVLSGKKCLLFNKDGSQVGNSTRTKLEKLEEGDTVTVGGKEVEVDGPIESHLYKSGRCFMNSTLKTTIGAVSDKPSIPVQKFKQPLSSASSLVPAKEVAVPIPRHNPAAENALVMPRPPTLHHKTWNVKKRPVMDVVVDPILGAHLRPHQRDGVKFLYECVMGFKEYDGCGAILADDMGLGKTLQSIALLWTLLKQSPYHGDGPIAKRALIVCPATLTQNWRKEFKKWLGDERIRVYVVDQKSEVRDFLLGKIYTVMIVGYEKLRTLEEVLKNAQFDVVVCDEGHRLKSTSIKTTQSLRKIATRRRVILSGTPIQNDLGEFFAMVDFINPGILQSYATFKKVYEDPIVRSRQPSCDELSIELGKQRSEELSRLTKMFILRRTSEVNAAYLPPKVELVIFCRPKPLQLAVYRSILDSPGLRAMFTGDRSQHLVCISLLRKLCNAPEMLLQDDDGQGRRAPDGLLHGVDKIFEGIKIEGWNPEISSKINVLHQLVLELQNTTDEKIVIVSNFTKTLDIIQAMCVSHDWEFFRLDGSTPAARRQEYVDSFNKPGCTKSIFLLSAKSGGVGLNLIGASRLVLFDVDWNPSVDRQAMARIHREHQKRKVFLYRFLTTGTIEEKMFQRQITKQSLSDSIMDDNGLDTSANQFSLEELRDVFTLHQDTDCLTHDLLECPCQPQRKVTTKSNGKAKKLDISELKEWTHVPAPFPSDRLDDPDAVLKNFEGDKVLASILSEGSSARDDVSFLFHRQSGCE